MHFKKVSSWVLSVESKTTLYSVLKFLPQTLTFSRAARKVSTITWNKKLSSYTICIVLARNLPIPVYLEGFLNPNLAITWESYEKTSHEKTSPNEQDMWAVFPAYSVFLALFTDSTQTKLGLNIRSRMRFMGTADEWNLFRLAEIVVAIRALLKAKAFDEWCTFHGFGEKLIALRLNPRRLKLGKRKIPKVNYCSPTVWLVWIPLWRHWRLFSK